MFIIKPNKYDDFNKVKKIIKSCKTAEHLKIAKKVVWFFGRKHGHSSRLSYDLHSFLVRMNGKITQSESLGEVLKQLKGL
tara:strand:- start:470 stop:709 length:240 start_codon:yes stop_codon:yes gene_type:complete